MNYVYLFLFFIIISISLLTGSSFYPNSDCGLGLMFFGVIGTIISLITIIVGIINNSDNNRRYKGYFNSIKYYQRNLKIVEESITKYKTEFKTILTEMYPEYEKSVIGNMDIDDTKVLSTLLVKYPELKFDGVLINYVGTIKELHSNIIKIKKDISLLISEIEDYEVNSWVLIKPKRVFDIDNLL